MRPWIVYIYVDDKGYPLSKNLEQKKVEERNMAMDALEHTPVLLRRASWMLLLATILISVLVLQIM